MDSPPFQSKNQERGGDEWSDTGNEMADDRRVSLPYSPPQASDKPKKPPGSPSARFVETRFSSRANAHYSPERQGSPSPATENNYVRSWEQQGGPSQNTGYSGEQFYHPGQAPSMENQGHVHYAYGPQPMSSHSSSFESYGSSHPYPPPHYVMSGPMITYPFGPGMPHPGAFYHPWAAPPPPKPIEYIRVIKSTDVLCGRGGATNSHSGNRSFRSMVKRHQDRYLKAKKRDKPSVASSIVELIRERGGRFLRRSEGNTLSGEVLWVDIGDERAKEKTCQALREGAPELRRRRGRKFSSSSDDEKDESPRKKLSLSPRDDSSKDEKRSPKPEDTKSSTYRVNAEPRDDAESHSDDTQSEEKLVIRPCSRLMRRPVRAIELSELTSREQQMYIHDFHPPYPNIKVCARRNKRIIIASRPRSQSDEEAYLKNDGSNCETWEV